MNVLPRDKRVLILRCLVEGMSIRSTARIADVSNNTVKKLLIDAGRVCAEYQDRTVRNLTCQRVEVDEIWSFANVKKINRARAINPPKRAGDVWTWVAIDRDSKLVLSWRIGDRTLDTALEFMEDIQARLANRIHLTSDGLKTYADAVEQNFGDEIDYGQLVKVYGTQVDGHGEVRDRRQQYLGSERKRNLGNRSLPNLSMSIVERQNLTMRMSMRRFTRRINAFSKKVENHGHAVALHFMFYNFCGIHQLLRVTPAMAHGIRTGLMETGDLVTMIE